MYNPHLWQQLGESRGFVEGLSGTITSKHEMRKSHHEIVTFQRAILQEDY